ncbi:DUF421 domain-containing protein [Candidatus Dependentiae bacterium]|nr:DUF421 domain-containing protein [Candidatus Dependentiae bacterium]
MLEKLLYYLDAVLGLKAPMLTIFHMAARATVVYTLAIILVRVSKKRFLAKPSSFDFVLILIFGAVLGKAITSSENFFATLGAAIVLVILHTFFSYVTFYSTKFGAIIKGSPLILIKEGQIDWENMQKSHITEKDLFSAIRRNAQILDVDKVKLAVLERSGEISVIPFDLGKIKPQVIEVNVEEGVQKVKIEFK